MDRMSPTSFVLNLFWILFGGFWMAAGWVMAAIIMAITIIGLPWTRAAFSIAAGETGQSPMAIARRLVVGARAYFDCHHARRDDCRHSIRLGAFEARWLSTLADWQDHRAGLALT